MLRPYFASVRLALLAAAVVNLLTLNTGVDAECQGPHCVTGCLAVINLLLETLALYASFRNVSPKMAMSEIKTCWM
jgi:hypothetical protein